MPSFFHRLAGINPRSVETPSLPTIKPPSIASAHACAYDITNDRFLYEKSADVVFNYPASVVKLMTAILIAESKKSALSSTVTYQSSDDVIFSRVGLHDGDVATFSDILHGILIPSGGDAAQAGARVVGNEMIGNAPTSTEGYARFVLEMNSRAESMGLSKSMFLNTNGGYENPFTARDLALLVAAAVSNPIISGIVAKTSHSIEITGANSRTINVVQTHPLVLAGDIGVLGGKTGTWNIDPVNAYNLSTAWEAPSGVMVAIATMNCGSEFNRTVDTRTIINALPIDFPYLA